MGHPASVLVVLVACLTLAPAPADSAGLQVLDEQGNPVADAVVDALIPPRGSDLLSRLTTRPQQASTDALGRADLALPAIEGAWLVVDHPQFAPYTRRLTATSIEDHVVLRTGSQLKGLVEFDGERLEHGKACATWEGEFENWVKKRTWSRCTSIDPAGRCHR